MLLERGARLLVGGVVRRDLGQRHAAQLGGKAWTQRDDVHRRVLRRFYVCSGLSSKTDAPARPRSQPSTGLASRTTLAASPMIARSANGCRRTRKQGARRRRGGRSTMMKARTLVLASLALGTASVAAAQDAVQLKF